MAEERTVKNEPPRLVKPWMTPSKERSSFCLIGVKFFKNLIFFLFKLTAAKKIIINAMYISKFILLIFFINK